MRTPWAIRALFKASKSSIFAVMNAAMKVKTVHEYEALLHGGLRFNL
jgi:hypothetical protein